MPHALLLSGRWMFNDEMIHVALRSLEWLHGVQSGPEGQFAPVGTEGWFPHGGDKAHFDQKPMEAAATIQACLEAHHVTEDRKWLDRAYRCLNWFLGDNDLRTPLYDPSTGGCHDGLMAHGVNENQGAESTLAWMLSLLSLYDQELEEDIPVALHEARKAKPADEPSNAPQPAPSPRLPAPAAEAKPAEPDTARAS
jgi:hypothetical protein